jgi:hypothetical protein
LGEQIVLGLGNNIDYEIVWDSQVLERLIIEFEIRDSEICTDIQIFSIRDLVVSILGFLKSESGGERFVTSLEIILDFASLFEKRITMGGTSLRAAIAMRKIGYNSALHLVTINDLVRKMIPQEIPWVCSNDSDSFYPHLIVQFNKGTCVQCGNVSINTKSANRIIYVNDHDNVAMEISPELESLSTDARVFLISGFNAMQSEELLSDKLGKLLSIIKSLPSETVVFYEDACYHNLNLNKIVREYLIPVIDVFSLNEDEMQEYLGRKIMLLDPVDVFAALQELHRLLPVPTLVIHTKDWCLVYGENVFQYAKSLKSGITMATTRFRFGDDFSHSDYLETEGLSSDMEKTKFVATLSQLIGEKVYCLPSFQVKEINVTNVGLGDSFVGGFLSGLVER